MCPPTAYSDAPGLRQKASGFQPPTQASWTSGTPGPQETAPAATKTQEPRPPACLDFPKYFGPGPNCHSIPGLRIEPGISYPLLVFEINLSSGDQYGPFLESEACICCISLHTDESPEDPQRSSIV